MHFAVINKSTVVAQPALLLMCEAALAQLLQHVAPAWEQVAPTLQVYGKEADAPPDACLVALLDNSDQADALGYHDVTPAGAPYARVFARPTLDNGGSLYTGSSSVSVTLSHELCEAYLDRDANYWADDGAGTLHALEACDAVEADGYAVPVRGASAWVSNFLLPAYFDAHVPPGTRLDYLGELKAPFSLAAGGYRIVQAAGQVTQQFGERYAAWRQATKLHPASRTARRLRCGTPALSKDRRLFEDHAAKERVDHHLCHFASSPALSCPAASILRNRRPDALGGSTRT